MSNEKEKVLDMLKDGKITAEDAARLLTALGGESPLTSAPAGAGRENRSPSLKGKKLRIKVEGDIDEMQNMNINIAVPLALARLADNIITSAVPKEVNKTLEDQGINLKGLNLAELVDNLSDLDEDIVNISMETDNGPLRVRIYVE